MAHKQSAEARMTGGQILIRELLARGVDTIFCVPGESYLAALDAIHEAGDRIKLVVWDGSGLVLVWKQLEAGAFRWPPVVDGSVRLTPVEFAALSSIQGHDAFLVDFRHFNPPIARFMASLH